MPRAPILLLKTKSTPHDGYEELFAAGERFDPEFVPVLEHHFNEEALNKIEDLITSGAFRSQQSPSDGAAYGGLIFTSQRAVEAFTTITDRIRTKHSIEPTLEHLLPRSIPLYVVGPATARGLRAIGLTCETVGEETGNGEALAAFVLDHYNSLVTQSGSTKRPLLFLVGEQRRDIIPKTLQSAVSSSRITVHEMTVYETGVMQSFALQFQKAVAPALVNNTVQWVVVFSPTGCRAMLEGLKLLDARTGKALDRPASNRTFIATIGPTTRDFLKREFSLEPDVCAAKPSPDGVADGIAKFEEAHGISATT